MILFLAVLPVQAQVWAIFCCPESIGHIFPYFHVVLRRNLFDCLCRPGGWHRWYFLILAGWIELAVLDKDGHFSSGFEEGLRLLNMSV